MRIENTTSLFLLLRYKISRQQRLPWSAPNPQYHQSTKCTCQWLKNWLNLEKNSPCIVVSLIVIPSVLPPAILKFQCYVSLTCTSRLFGTISILISLCKHKHSIFSSFFLRHIYFCFYAFTTFVLIRVLYSGVVGYKCFCCNCCFLVTPPPPPNCLGFLLLHFFIVVRVLFLFVCFHHTINDLLFLLTKCKMVQSITLSATYRRF